MAGGEDENRRLETLFPAEEVEHAGGDGSPELVRLQEHLEGRLSRYELVILWAQRLLVWERPLNSILLALTLNTAFWLLSSTSMRPIFLLNVSLIGLVLLERLMHRLPLGPVQFPEVSRSERESAAIRLRFLSVPEVSHHLAEGYLTCSLHLQEMIQYKRQNRGKFCGLACAGCLVLALVGHYIPGVIISYIILLNVLLWPLVVYHKLIQMMCTGLDPILINLDYSLNVDTQHRNLDRKEGDTDTDTESDFDTDTETETESEEELSCFAPTVDVKTTTLAIAIADSGLSDQEASVLESGGLSGSRATTPQLTDVSEDLDQRNLLNDPVETLPIDLPEIPSTEHFLLHCSAQPLGAADTGEEPGSPTCLHLPSPLHFVNTHFNGQGGGPTVSSPISTVVQNTLSPMPVPSGAEPEDATPGSSATRASTPSSEEFELVDQSELEQMEAELGSEELRSHEATPTAPPNQQSNES